MKPNFDTHEAYVSLINAGFDDKKATQLVETIKQIQVDLGTGVATKSDTREIMLLIKGLYVAGVFAFAVLGWLCLQVFEISKSLPSP